MMKVFKTIIWTSLFWILVIVGTWVASYWYTNELLVIIPEPIKTALSAQQQEACTLLPETPVGDQTTGAQELLPEEVVSEELIPDAGLEDLQFRVDTLESEFYRLVGELNSIFATPEGQRLVSGMQEPAVVEPIAVPAEGFININTAQQ